MARFSESVPCNAFGTLFAENNVRFAVALEFPSTNVHAVKNAIRGGVLPQPVARFEARPSQDATSQSWTLYRRKSSPTIRHALWTGSIEDAVEEAVFQSDTSSPNSQLSITIFAADGYAHGVCIDANHVLCDGRAMMIVVRDLSARLVRGTTPAEPENFPTRCAMPPSWAALVRRALDNPSVRDVRPLYLPRPPDVLALRDVAVLCSRDQRPRERDLHITVEAIAARNAQSKAKSNGASVTGLWTACIATALARAYFSSEGAKDRCAISVSVLVDLRPVLSVIGDGATLAQAIGTVVTTFEFSSDQHVLLACEHIVDKDEGGASAAGARVDELERRFKRLHKQIEMQQMRDNALRVLATAATRDVRARVSRGEALRSAAALCAGRFDAPELTATIELSNHGVYEVAPAMKLLIAQRFDAYQGASIVIHSESGSGRLRVAAACGDDVDRNAYERVIRDAVSMYTF